MRISRQSDPASDLEYAVCLLSFEKGGFIELALAVEAPRFGKGKGSGAKEDSSPASVHIIT